MSRASLRAKVAITLALATSALGQRVARADEPSSGPAIPVNAQPDASPPEPPPAEANLPASSPSPEPSPAPTKPVEAVSERPREPSILGGRIFTHFRMPTSDPRNQRIHQASASAWLDIHPKLDETVSARAILTADAFGTSLDGTEGVRANVREAYVTFAKSGWEARVGQQILPWGNADAINPTDVLSARDYGFFAVDSEVRRIGAISAKGSWTPNAGDSPWTFTLVTTPIFPSSRLVRPPGVVPDGVVVGNVERPPLVPVNIETAARIAYAGSGWDVAVIGFRGFNHTPEIELVQADATATVLRQVHRRNLVAGLEGSVSPGKWVLRFEGAYVSNRDRSGADPRTQPSHLFGVLGVERPLGERFRLQLQGVSKYSQDWASPDSLTDPDPRRALVGQQVARVDAILLDYTERVRVAGTARLAFTSETELVEAEVFVIAHAFGGDGVVRPLLSIRPADPLRFSLGAETLFGPPSSPLGGLRHYSGAFFEARYTF